MPFRIFAIKGGGQSTQTYHPFKVLIGQSNSGVGASSIDSKCPCDTEETKYTSSNFFKFTPGEINQSGKLSVKVFSGSNLYSSLSLKSPFIHSYASKASDVSPEAERDCGVMRIYGLDSPIFIQSFFGNNPTSSATLKIWLTVCFPSGRPEEEPESAAEASDPLDLILHSCKERANKPMGAFISCSTGSFPKAAILKLINKGTDAQPRYEKRQISANIPIAEVTYSGVIVRQFLNTNLCLTDINVQGFGCRMPLALFSELG